MKTEHLVSRNDALELAAILDTLPSGVFVIDSEHRIRRWNRAMERLTGYSAEEALGKPCTILRCAHMPEDERPLAMLDCDLSARGKVDARETLIRRKDGSEIPLLVSARIMQDPNGEEVGSVVSFTDLSQLKKLEYENQLLRAEARQLVEFDNLVGRSARMQEVYRLLELAAASEETILIQGETGTGKELAAKAIHHHSARADDPFVALNCSALSETLLESELFGHVKGAFTGAHQDHRGRFEAADGGTLFLDEIGEVSPRVQVKLLRVLQERSFERVGDNRTRHADVRLIAATHRDLQAMVREGRFREDLYYRLKIFPITLPPLRERKEDIELLLVRFVEQARERTGKKITDVAPDAMRMIMDHAWPGNVRELENAVAHAFVTCPGGRIGPFDLPIELRQVRVSDRIGTGATHAAPAPTPPPARTGPLDAPAIQAAINESGGNKAEAARRLGIDRTTLWRKMKVFNMNQNGGKE